jgi:hypothetical protein
MDKAMGAPAAEARAAPPRTGRVLPFARPGALLPSDRQAIACFAARLSRARLQFVELDAGRCAAMLDVAGRQLCIERRGDAVVARKVSGGAPLVASGADEVLAAAEAWLLAGGAELHPAVAQAG